MKSSLTSLCTTNWQFPYCAFPVRHYLEDVFIHKTGHLYGTNHESHESHEWEKEMAEVLYLQR